MNLLPGTTGYIVLFHFGGATGFDVTMDASVDSILVANLINEDDDNNNNAAGAQLIPALPGGYLDGVLNSVTDEDWIQVTVTAADAGKDLFVATSGPADNTDTVITAYTMADPSTPIVMSDDNVFYDTLTVPGLAAGRR